MAFLASRVPAGRAGQRHRQHPFLRTVFFGQQLAWRMYLHSASSALLSIPAVPSQAAHRLLGTGTVRGLYYAFKTGEGVGGPRLRIDSMALEKPIDLSTVRTSA